METREFLFHGSNHGGLIALEPRISLEYKPRVYATADYRYALVRAGKQVDAIREEYYGIGNFYELAECYPDAFKMTFDCTGYIYMLDKKDFIVNPDDPDEYICNHAVPVINCETVDNLWRRMTEIGGYDLHYYGDEVYWANVRGGLEGFLERKLARKKKMLEMINAR